MKDLPTRFLPRAAATGRMVMHLGRAAARRVVRQREADAEELGEALFGELDELKGLAMKVGQILSYMDVGLPEATVRRLARLQEGAEALPYEAIRGVVEQELGAPMGELFDRFAPEPIAAASIGQVHRAWLGGRSVAVKVRYPAVRETLEGDLSQLHGLGRLASIGTAVDGPALVRELHARMLEECDYELEAARQQQFADSWVGDADLVVPHTVPERCSGGVLTTTWVDGAPLETLRDSDPGRILTVSRALLRFGITSLVRDRRIQADPHPGNFLVLADGRVAALDYGCVRQFAPEVVAAWVELARVVIEGRRESFLDAIVATGQVPDPDHYDVEEGWQLHRFLFEPYLTHHFRFERRWWVRGLRVTQPTAANQRRVAIPPPWIWLMRMQWGLHAVLVRLHAEGDFRAPFEACLGLWEADAPSVLRG